MTLTGQVALVTGAGSGIGREIAQKLASLGARVALAGRRKDRLEETAAAITARGGEAAVFPADLSREPDAARAADGAAERFHSLSILVNNAGRGASAPLAKTTPALFGEMLAANVVTAFNATRAALPHFLRAGSGRIVNVASVAGLRGYPYVSAYCAAKHALVGLTRALAVELAPKCVTVNAVCPGYVDTEMTAETVRNIVRLTGKSEDEARRALEDKSPAKRLFTPEEVAAAVAYLCCPSSIGVSGQAIAICGGETAG